MKIFTVRLLPGTDLRQGIEEFAEQNDIRAGHVSTCVGSVTKAHLRMASAKTFKGWHQPLEIVSLVGTVSKKGCHLHVALSDEEGNLVGGHVAAGCVVGTTAEVVVIEDESSEYTREPDDQTGYDELVVKNR